MVYKQPALVAAVAAYTDCAVELSTAQWSHGLIVEDNRPAVPGYKDTKVEEMLESTKIVLKHFKVDVAKVGVKITLGGDLCAVSGIGASAANCVALARALSHALGQKLTEEEINAAGYEGEKGYHGTPSGIDNTAATYGGLLRFQRTDGAPIFEPKSISTPGLVVYASTGITASTSKVVGGVATRREADPSWYNALEERYRDIFAEAEQAVEAGDWAQVGKLADRNHTLLQDLGVSCKELDELVLAARKAGALGAKMAGTGQGGLMWAVVSDVATQDAVAAALEALAPQAQVWKTSYQ